MRIDSVDGWLDLGADSVVVRHRRRVGGDADPRGQSRGRVAVELYERDQVGPVNDRVGDQRRLPQFLFDLQSDYAPAGQVSRDDPSRDSASWRARQVSRC
jgi:hypothetical protein